MFIQLLILALALHTSMGKPVNCFFMCDQQPSSLTQMPVRSSYVNQPYISMKGVPSGGYVQRPYMGSMLQRNPMVETFNTGPAIGGGYPIGERQVSAPVQNGEALFLHSSSSSSNSATHGMIRYPIMGQTVQTMSEPIMQYPAQPCLSEYTDPCII